MHHLWLIPVLPLAGAAINGLFGRRLSKGAVNAVAIGSVFLSFLWVLKTLAALSPLETAYVEHARGADARAGAVRCRPGCRRDYARCTAAS